MSRPANGIAKFYHRDSLGKSVLAPAQYVKWACQDSKIKGLTFDGRPEIIDEMIKKGQHQRGDLFLDYGVRGRDLDRLGLNALMKELKSI